ncbi:MAG: [FeFe] hydrogenase, group A [Candidatus Peregrinibacteria bacterium]
MKKIAFFIDNRKVAANEGESVFRAALRHKIEIPHFCCHEDLPIDANCRTCLVEIQPKGKVVTSCDLMPKPGLMVYTNSPLVQKLRRENLELLLADHKKLCAKCSRGLACKTADLMKKYRVSGIKYHRAAIREPAHKMGTAAEFSPQACISCNKCVEMCQKIGIGFLELTDKGAQSHLTYNKNPKVDCIYCGQCTVHCPVTAVREQSHLEEVEAAIADKSKILIAQMSPSTRASIGEEFGLKPGTNLEGQMVTALKKLGFDKVFDVNMGADITTWVEAEELAHRIRHKGVLPMFTSCCPGWVKFAEFYHPEILKHLTMARSPQIHSGGAYKTWWAKRAGVDPKKIVVVSLMPCTSKKYESTFEKLKINGMKPVDFVLTTRELGSLLRKHHIDLPKLKPGKLDYEGTYSGAGAIYGATGGVMESALRSAYYFLTGKELKKVEFKKVRGMQGIKKATIKIGKRNLKVAVVYLARNAQKVIAELKKNPKAYDYIEVMACPGGCIGGGGQPIPSTEAIIAKRIEGLYKIDSKMKLRKAHENPVVRDFMLNYIPTLPKKQQAAILHTNYKRKKKFE